ncbi:MAG: hypothetical protein AAFN77_18450 [Planctomycetota bacterium]
MDASIKQVLIWKERKLLVPLAIGLVATVLLVLIGMIIINHNLSDQELAQQVFGVTVLFGCLVALCFGTMMFSPEREEGTDQLLSAFPVRNDLVARTKVFQATRYFLLTWLVSGVAATAIFFVASGTLNISVTAYEGRSAMHVAASIFVSLIVPVECFLWSLITSSRCHKSINAILLAAAYSIAGVVVVSFWFSWFGIRTPDSTMPFWMLSGHGLLIAIQVFLLKRSTDQWLRRRVDKTETVLDPTGGLSSITSVTRIRPHNAWKSLLWQTWKLQRTWVLWACLAAVVSVIVAGVSSLNMVGLDAAEIRSFFNVFCYSTAAILGIIVGLTTFSSDQSRRDFRFFQQQSEYAGLIWLSRMIPILIVGIAAVIAISFITWLAYGLTTLTQMNWKSSVNDWYYYQRLPLEPLSIWRFMFVFLGVAGVGQLVSIFVRSSIAMVLTGGILCWLSASVFSYTAWLNEPLWSFGWPFVAACFLASWLYSGSWIREQRWWQSALSTTLVLLVIAGGSIGGLIYHRSTEVPTIEKFEPIRRLYANQSKEMKSDPDRYAAALQIEKALTKSPAASDILERMGPGIDKSRELTKPIEQWDDEFLSEYVTENREAIDMIIPAIADQRSRYFLSAFSKVIGVSQTRMVRQLLEADFHYQLKQGNLDRALDAAIARFHSTNLSLTSFGQRRGWEPMMIRWSAAEGQTAEKILGGIARLEQAMQTFAEDDLKLAEAAYLEAIQIQYNWLSRGNNVNRWNVVENRSVYMPSWEVKRGMNLWQKLLFEKYRMTWLQPVTSRESYTVPIQVYLDRPRSWMHNREEPLWDHTSISFSANNPFRGTSTFVLAFRYTITRMALEAFRVDNGRYPAKLSGLEPKYLPRVPAATDGRSFAYSATGLELPVIYPDLTKDNYLHAQAQFGDHRAWKLDSFVPSGKPFLLPWSGIPQMKRTFVFVQQKSESELETGVIEEAQPITESDRQEAYWVPPVGEPGTITNYFIIPTEDFVLEH